MNPSEHGVTSETKEQAELAPSPSHQGWRNFTLYTNAAVEEALSILGDVAADPLAHTGMESAQQMTAKTVLREYCAERRNVGTKRATRSEQRSRHGIQKLMAHDFCIDVDFAAKRAFRRRPCLLRAFSVLFSQERGERATEFAKVAPRTFTVMLTLLGMELRRRSVRITGLSSYLRQRTTERAR